MSWGWGQPCFLSLKLHTLQSLSGSLAETPWEGQVGGRQSVQQESTLGLEVVRFSRRRGDGGVNTSPGGRERDGVDLRVIN